MSSPHSLASRSFVASLAAACLASFSQAGEPAKNPGSVTQAPVEDPLGFSFGGILYPHLHAHGVFGESSGDPESLAAGHHDPNNNGFTLQGLEVGLSGRFTDWLETFGAFHLAYNEPNDEWEHGFEEWFAKVKNLPGGFELRGGKFLNRFGLQNAVHLHGWDWADQYLVNGRFLGDHHLASIGGEVSWMLPVPWTSSLGVSVGVMDDESHDHDHEHGEHAEETLYEGEGALFDDLLTTVHWTNQFNLNDFHQFLAGASAAWGDNTWGRQSAVYGIHFEYQWRENGLEAGGSYFRWRNEVMLRRFGAVSGHLPGEEHDHEEHEEHEHEEHAHAEDHHEDEHGHEEHHEEEEHHHEDEAVRRATLTEAGFYTDLRYGWESGLEVGLRGEWVEGIGDAGLDERFRVSPGVTYYFKGKRNFLVRLQYNYDHSSDWGDEHSVWAQVGFNFGGPEVR